MFFGLKMLFKNFKLFFFQKLPGKGLALNVTSEKLPPIFPDT